MQEIGGSKRWGGSLLEGGVFLGAYGVCIGECRFVCTNQLKQGNLVSHDYYNVM